jgi:transcriptional regulator
MHTTKAFKVDDPDSLLQIMRENAFATLITNDVNGRPTATQLPFLIKEVAGNIILQAHFAKANPQWKQLETNQLVLVIFNGPHCYISPTWYENAGVPTWDYVTVQSYGVAKLFENNQQTAELIEELTDKYEQGFEKPWKANNNYPDKMLNAIIGFEITVQEIQGKVKIGQNKSREDLEGVVKALNQSPRDNENAVSSLIKKYLNTHLKSKD